jgi:putative Ca2+/H+ antiporter (TMEM165/GDT1 family)
MIDVGLAATVFALILPAELPDKTFIATLVLATRFVRWQVWLGVAAAFALQTTIAVTAGGLLSLAPERLVLGITFTLFVVGAVIMAKGGLQSRASFLAQEKEEEAEVQENAALNEAPRQATFSKVFVTSFLVLFAAEWGDLSQILTAGMAARTGEPVSVFLGAWLALITVAAAAVLLGGWLQSRIPIWRIRLVSAVVLSALAVWTAMEFIQA